MRIFLIGYDLNKRDNNDSYAILNDAINKLSTPNNIWHELDSTWIVKTELSISQIDGFLREFINYENDKLLILELLSKPKLIGLDEKVLISIFKNLPESGD